MIFPPYFSQNNGIFHKMVLYFIKDKWKIPPRKDVKRGVFLKAGSFFEFFAAFEVS